MAEEATLKVDSPPADAGPETPTEAPAAPDVPENQRVKPNSLPVGRFGLEPEYNTIWRVNVPMEVTPDNCLDEKFWAHIARHLRVGDTIRVVPDNWNWEQWLHVAGAGKTWAHMVRKELYDLRTTKTEIALPPVYKVEFAGPHHKFRVLREGNLLRDGFETEKLARQYAANHEAAVDR